MAEQLTPQQETAVYNRGGRLLVSAAAGSGKTKVLVDRLMSYLLDPIHPANIDQFLIITFTKAAASELRGKIASKLTELVAADPGNTHLRRQMQHLYLTKISTVHGFCSDVLREFAYRLNIPGDFRVADENECNELRLRVMEKILEEAYVSKLSDSHFRAFIDSQGLGRDDRQIPHIVLQVYDSSRCHPNPEQWLQHCENQVNISEMQDASESEYGAFLMERLQNWLDAQIEMLEDCCRQGESLEGFEKPIALFQNTIHQLRHLRESATWQDVVQRKKIEFGVLRFPKSCADEALIERMKAVREACKEDLKKRILPFHDTSEKVLQDLKQTADALHGLTEMVRSFAAAYDAAKQSRRILDFADLEHKMLDLLLGKNRTHLTAAAEELGNRFVEVMVDEYQDSNQVQDMIYESLTAKKNNLFMVGDVKQSIYQFRLADPGIFLDKYLHFKPSEKAIDGEDRKVVLSRNFRSSAGVLEGCNDVFRCCMTPQVGGMYYGAEEALYEGLKHVPFPDPEVELCCVDVREETYPEEAAFVVEHIQKMLESGTVRDGNQLRPVKPEDIVILLRSPGSLGMYYQRALERVGIPFSTGGGVDLLKTQEIGTLYSILQMIHNPRMDIPLVAAMCSPIFGFTADELAHIRSKYKIGAFYDALIRDASPKCQEFLHQLNQMRGAVRYNSLTRLLEQVYLLTSIEEIYGAMDESQLRLNHLQTFYQLAADFEARGNRDLGCFLEHLASMEERGLISAGEDSASGCVTIMSIHKSKGLEFPVVYLCGLGREFNSENQRAAVLCHKSMGLGLSAVDPKNRLRYPTIAKRAISMKIGMDSISEELRVLYVAMTRAKDRLIMTYASNRLEKDITQIVQYLDSNGKEMLTNSAVCPGDWVLLTALQKTEAGELFVQGAQPKETVIGTHPWKIRRVTSPQLQVANTASVAQEKRSCAQLEELSAGLSFRYGHTLATCTASKQTATGRKGRTKDEEAVQFTTSSHKANVSWRTPRNPKADATQYGNAIHAVMQHIDYSKCTSPLLVSEEIHRLTDSGFLTKDQADMVNPQTIVSFFDSDIGSKIRSGNVLREFKFSILEDGALHDPELAGEQILLQGVVDCALLEEDGITIIDFKSDRMTDHQVADKVAFYTPQIESYSKAMARIFKLPVKKRFLYFFHIGQFAAI